MFKPRFQSTLVGITAFSIVAFATVPDAVADSSESGGFFSKLFGSFNNAIYKRTPDFKNYVAPYILNMNDFDAFMDQYNFKKKLSEKDSIDISIKLGVLKYKPEWLNKKALDLIDKYYPGLRGKRADAQGPNVFAQNCDTKVAGDFSDCNYEVAQGAARVIPMVLFSSVTLQMVSQLTLNGLSKKNTLETWKEEIQQLEIRIEDEFCKGSCSHESVSDDDKKGKEENCEEEWAEARKICAREMKKYSPSRTMTGGYKDILDCAKGFVSQACGGNHL